MYNGVNRYISSVDDTTKYARGRIENVARKERYRNSGRGARFIKSKSDKVYGGIDTHAVIRLEG